MDRKLDSERTIVQKIARREVLVGLKRLGIRKRSSNFVQHYAYGGTGSGFGGGGTTGDTGLIKADAYTEDNPGVVQTVSQKKLQGEGSIYLYEDKEAEAIEVRHDPLSDPTLMMMY
jgi:hypothetical protein